MPPLIAARDLPSSPCVRWRGRLLGALIWSIALLSPGRTPAQEARLEFGTSTLGESPLPTWEAALAFPPADSSFADFLELQAEIAASASLAYDAELFRLSVRRGPTDPPCAEAPIAAIGFGGGLLDHPEKLLELLDRAPATFPVLFSFPAGSAQRYDRRSAVVDGEVRLSLEQTDEGNYVEWPKSGALPGDPIVLREGGRAYEYTGGHLLCHSLSGPVRPDGWKIELLGWDPEEHGGVLDPRVEENRIPDEMSERIVRDDATGDIIRLTEHVSGGRVWRQLQRFSPAAPGVITADERVTFTVSLDGELVDVLNWMIVRRWSWTEVGTGAEALRLPTAYVRASGFGSITLANAVSVDVGKYRYSEAVPDESARWSEFDVVLRRRTADYIALTERMNPEHGVSPAMRERMDYPPLVIDRRLPAKRGDNTLTYRWGPRLPTDEELLGARHAGRTHIETPTSPTLPPPPGH